MIKLQGESIKKVKRTAENMLNGSTDDLYGSIEVYSQSFSDSGSDRLLVIKVDGQKYILAVGGGDLYSELSGDEYDNFKVCNLTHDNRLVINKYFPYTLPSAFGKNTATIGLGDRLGLASPGHIKLLKQKEVKPILAQQSLRELSLTGRTWEDVLDFASFAVFQEGYKGGFGADGDHLKAIKDIKNAIDAGYSMITLDCSEKIDNSIDELEIGDIEDKYNKLDNNVRRHYEEKYLNKTFNLASTSIAVDKCSLMKIILIYDAALDFIQRVYKSQIEGKAIDFEISIDETLTSTSPDAHYVIASEILDRNIEITSMAPRFCGEFQKGIDYIGDVKKFEMEFKVHAEIADKFGYKISIHSGSDKFSVFPVIGKYTSGRFHLKTSGTNWLEAIRVIARMNPALYKKMHSQALVCFEEARAYYHVTTNLKAIAPLDNVSDGSLVDYLNHKDARQLMHITYGILLQAKDEEGKYLFRDEFFKTLNEYEGEYDKALIGHIGRHLDLLGK